MASKTELEEQLMKVGKKLLQPPTAVDELLSLLDQAETLLSKVEQSPPRPMQSTLSLSIKALVEDELLRHSNMDVRVSVASCISEITRITAPDAPYDDDKMKDIFQLIVSSLENISDLSSRSYSKRKSILETVAKVRSCVVMLDLECDELINEMFHLFMNAIRNYHPESIFSAMETIMTLVLEESEDISMELIQPILASLRKDNKDILPVARRLGERVIENSALKLRSYIMQAVDSNWISLDDYTEIISNLNDGKNIIKHCDPDSTGQLRGENFPNGSSEKNNGAAESTEEGPESSKKTVNGQPVNAEERNQENVVMLDSNSKEEKPVKKNGRNLKSSIKRNKPSDSLPVKRKKKAEEAADDSKNHAKDTLDATSEEPSVEGMMPSEIEKESEELVLEAKDVTQSAPKSKVRRQKKETLSQGIVLPVDVSKEHGTSVLEEKLPRSSGKKASGDMKELVAKRKKLDASEKKERRKWAQEKATPEKDTSSQDHKGVIWLHKSLSRLPKDEDKSSKRKRGSRKDKVTDTKDYDADLVGSKVKVWWPKDKEFYEGVIDAYDPVEKKHKVLYDDGDQEELNLKKERWELIEDGSEVQKSGRQGSDLSKMNKEKKPEISLAQPAATKQENVEPSGRDAESFSSKMKGVAKKLARNSMDGGSEKKPSEPKSSSRVKSDEDNENKSKKNVSSSKQKSTQTRPVGMIKKKDVETLKLSNKGKKDNTPEDEEDTEIIPKGKIAQNIKSQSKGKAKSNDEETESDKELGIAGKRKSMDGAKTSGTASKMRKKN